MTEYRLLHQRRVALGTDFALWFLLRKEWSRRPELNAGAAAAAVYFSKCEYEQQPLICVHVCLSSVQEEN